VPGWRVAGDRRLRGAETLRSFWTRKLNISSPFLSCSSVCLVLRSSTVFGRSVSAKSTTRPLSKLRNFWSLFLAWIFAQKISTVATEKACYVACSKHVFFHRKCFMLEEAAGTATSSWVPSGRSTYFAFLFCRDHIGAVKAEAVNFTAGST